jgi:hypothetical protein
MISMPAWGGSFTHAVAIGLTAAAVLGFGAAAASHGATIGSRTSPVGVVGTDAQGHYLIAAAGAPIWKSEADTVHRAIA